MERKDYFSQQAKTYAAFRPTYPEPLYQFLIQHLNGSDTAWDCATGNGQVAQRLARHFTRVYATDISAAQLEHAQKADNIFYSLAAAENSAVDNQQFDLITVAQALHWFNLPLFYQEVKRTAKTGALLAVWGYGLLSVDTLVDTLFNDFYSHEVGPYWDEGRRLIENRYADILFPFPEIKPPEFSIEVRWTQDQFTGYLSSWSATQKFIKVKGYDPVEKFRKDLEQAWPSGETKTVIFPLFMRVGRVSG